MKTSRFSIVLSGLLLLSITANAHHSAAAFDPNITVAVTGTVEKLEWTSPHARLHVNEVQEDGSTMTWNFELPSPVGLMRKGWRRDDLSPGEVVTVTGFRAKAYEDIGIAESVQNGEGKALFSNL